MSPKGLPSNKLDCVAKSAVLLSKVAHDANHDKKISYPEAGKLKQPDVMGSQLFRNRKIICYCGSVHKKQVNVNKQTRTQSHRLTNRIQPKIGY